MAITAVQIHTNADEQFRGTFHHVAELEATWDPDNVSSNSEFHEEITVPGAVLGDMILVSIDVDVQKLDVVGHVTAPNTVTVGLHNSSQGAVNLASCNLHLVLLRPQHVVG